MLVRICDNAEMMGLLAANEAAEQIKAKKESILILPTGSTPIPMYNNIAEKCSNKEISFKDVVTFNLDEYIGIEENHEERYFNFMKRNLFLRVDINMENVNIPDSRTDNPTKECERYEKKYRETGCADLAFLGIGQNGHIGFNEPNTPFDSKTHVVSIADSTIKANSRFFASIDLVPKQAMTMGISTIMSAKKIVLLITGKSKHDILMQLLSADKADPEIPATVLLNHDNVVVYCDREAING